MKNDSIINVNLIGRNLGEGKVSHNELQIASNFS